LNALVVIEFKQLSHLVEFCPSFHSICLPMEANTTGAVVYLSFLLLFNGLAFLLVATAYLQMYRAVAGHGGGAGAAAPGASSADTAIAKKMALLVFTDFACWAPVAFFGLTAVGGYPLIGNLAHFHSHLSYLSFSLLCWRRIYGWSVRVKAESHNVINDAMQHLHRKLSWQFGFSFI
jgi:hypothetical protein